MVDDGEDLEEYRERVVAELSRRSDRVRRLEQELASKAHQLEDTQRRRQVIAGDTGRVLAQESYRAVLRKAIARLEVERREAMDELEMARRRLEQVEAELAAEIEDDLDDVDGGEEAIGKEIDFATVDTKQSDKGSEEE